MENRDNSKVTAYPIVLLHGMGVRDSRLVNSWGRIPSVLRDNGFTVFHGGQDANGTVENNAKMLQHRIEQILARTGAEKVNLIAHSKGGLESRFLITHLKMGGKIASLTTIATPHYGSKTMDVLMRFPKPLLWLGCRIADLIVKLMGDRQPRTYEALHSLCTPWAREFNHRTPDDPGVYYQSYGFYMKHWYSDLFLLLPYLVVHSIEGQCDGLVAVESVRWGRFRGLYTGNSRLGVSHCHEVDMYRRRLTKKNGSGISDMPQFILSVAEELGDMGF